MRNFSVSLTVLTVSFLATVQAGCTRDACYNNVAVSKPKGPNLASRLADCSSILKTVIDDNVTRTTTIFSTASPITTTISEIISTATVLTTSTSSSLPKHRKRSNTSFNDLEARDKIVIKGIKPAYATSCNSDQDYAIACLCYGVKAGKQKTITQIKTIQTIVTEISTTTTPITKTITSTLTAPAAKTTSCNSAQLAFCQATESTCTCKIDVDDSRYICARSWRCEACTTDADCEDFGPFGARSPGYCAYNSDGNCGGMFEKICFSPIGLCPAPQNIAKRELERVFGR